MCSFFSRRAVNVVNLDPAAEYFDYQPLVDIRDLVRLANFQLVFSIFRNT